MRAKQGKLKAVKFGRNWVTKKEWLAEYFQNVENYNNNVKDNQKIKKSAVPPSGLPVEKMPVLRFGFVAALAFVLMVTSVVSGKTPFQNFYDQASPLAIEFTENFDKGAALTIQKSKTELLSIEVKVKKRIGFSSPVKIQDLAEDISNSFANVGVQTAEVGGMFGNYGQWISGQVSELRENTVLVYSVANDFIENQLRELSIAAPEKIPEGLVQEYTIANEFAEEKLGWFTRKLVQDYIIANEFAEEKLGGIAGVIKEIPGKVVNGYIASNDFVEEKLKQGLKTIARPFVRAYNLVAVPWRGILPDKLAVEEISKEEFESLREEIEKMKEEGLPVKEVIQVTQVQPVKEVTKEVTKIDEKSLKAVKLDIEELQVEVAKRLYAPGGVITQQIYITEPIASPKIYQENGDIVLQTAGSGNVILSAATGMQISGSQVVIDSTSILNPLVYITDKTRIAGDTTIEGDVSIGGAIIAQRITLSAVSDFAGNVLDVQAGGTSQFSVTEVGNATLVGNFTIGGDLTVSGAQTYSGAAAFTASSTASALSVTQNGTGNIVEFKDGSTSVFTIADGGYASLAVNASTTPSFLIRDQDTTWTTASSTYFAIAATSTFAGRFVDFEVGTTSIFYIDNSGNAVFSGSITAEGMSGTDFTGAVTITTVTQPQLEIRYDTSNMFTVSVSESGVTTASSTGDIVLVAAGTERMRIASSTGNIGIGTTTSSVGLSLQASSTDGYFMVSNVNDGDIFVIDENGYVGIGTTSPATTLDVDGTLTVTQIDAFILGGDMTIADTKAFKTGIATSNYFGFEGWDSDQSIYREIIKFQGGVAVPYFILGSTIFYYNGVITGINIDSGTMAGVTLDGNLNTGNQWLSGDGGSEGIMIDDDGLVGIGTTTPSFGLSLQASSTGGYFGVSNVADSDIFVIDESGYVGIATSSPASTLSVYGTTTMMGGFVGIGTENPSYNLDVVGQVSVGSANQFQIDSGGNVIGASFSAGDYIISAPSGGIITSGIVGIGTSTPAFGLSLQASSTDGYFGVSNVNDGDIFVIDEGGNVGIGTSTPNALLHIYGSAATSTLTVQQTGSGNIVDFMSTSTSIFTLKSDDYLKYRAGLVQTWGTINDVIVDDFEDNDVTDWTSDDATNTKVSATTTYFRVNDYALAITSATGSSNGDTATTSVSTTDWSSYERLSFWIRASYTTTSTGATTTQIISAQFASSTSAQTHNITIDEMGQWQYEEWDISGITGRTSISWVGFRIDVDDGSPTFYVDHIRLYDNDLQAGEMFVDSGGNLVIWGQQSVEIGRTSASGGSLPSIKAGTAVIEFNQPISVNVGGDVGFDYDIYFANTGLSQITSAGPLAILAGDPNHAENLTLGTQGTGDVIIDIINSTTSYGGFKIIGSDSGSYVVRISPDGDVYIGGTGEGGSDLWVKQNITQRGGEMQIKPLDVSEAEDLSVADNTTDAGVCTTTESILYRITAMNDNGETTPSAMWAASTTKATSSVDISWQPVEGATKYKLYRTAGYRLNDGETVWTAATTSVTVSATTTQVKVGTYSAGLSISATTSVGLVATSTVGTSNLSLQSSVAFWIRSSIDIDRGDLKLVLDETADCLSPDESLSVPALSANSWKFVKLPFERASTTRDAAACVGISLATDRGAQDVYVDEVLSSDDNSFFIDGAQISTASSTSYTDDCTGADDTAASPPTQNTTGGKIVVYRGNDYYGSEATTTVFGVDEAVVSIGYPLNVTTGGDVGISYDLQFLNTGSTYITSAGPLWVQAGSPNKTQNLVLTVAGESGKDSGDVIVDVRYSNNTYGGFKVIGDDSGGYVFKVSPAGDIDIGGAGSGGSDLTLKQNLTLLGGNITINQLATTTAPTLSTTTSGYTEAATYYYRITSANDNGQTTGSATTSITTNASEVVVVSWDGVTGATKHYVWRSTTTDWNSSDDYRIEVAAPSTAYQDTATGTQSTSTYPTSNTTGGELTTSGLFTAGGDILPATTTGTSSAHSLGGAGSVWSAIHVVTEYVGDIIFANQFRVTEAMSSPEALIFQNGSTTEIMRIDEAGQLTLTKLVAEMIETEQLQVRDSTPAQTGITIYDRNTDEPYCFYVEAGVATTTSGACQ